MRERPILFSAPMVRAILEGRKTQTRRPAKLDRVAVRLLEAGARIEGQPSSGWGGVVLDEGGGTTSVPIRAPYGFPGDRLWVRETWAAQHAFDAFKPSEINWDAHWHYAATEERGGLLWRPSIHMPRWASRITLEVTGVRIERLHAITDEDAKAEGAEPFQHPSGAVSYRDGFARLWGEINGTFDENVWVWVVEFKRLESTAKEAA